MKPFVDRLSNTGKRAMKSITTEENLRGHFLGKIQGRKRACAMCVKVGRERPHGRFDTAFICEQCGTVLVFAGKLEATSRVFLNGSDNL